MHNIIIDIIRECIEANAAFSIHDILPEARARGCKLMRHEIEDIIQEYDGYPRYYKTAQKVAKNGVHVFIRHPADYNPNDYDVTDISGATAYERAMTSTEEVNAPLCSGASRASIIRRTSLFDKDGRFSVPATDVRSAGFLAGERIALMYSSNWENIVLVPLADVENRSEINTTLTIDCWFGLRIRQKHFKCMATGIPEDIKIETAPKRLILSPRSC